MHHETATRPAQPPGVPLRMSWFKASRTPDAPTTPTRALDTTFSCDASKWVYVSYSIQFVVAAGQSSTVELRIDSASPPTTPRSRIGIAVTGSGDSDTPTFQLTGWVPPGNNVRLVSSGTGTPSIVAQTEVAVM